MRRPRRRTSPRVDFRRSSLEQLEERTLLAINPLAGPAPEDLPSDLTGNGFVDFQDLTVLLANWNKPGATPAEGNLVSPDETSIDFQDLTVLLAAWTGPDNDPTGISQISPANGEEMVNVTRETIVRFDERVDPATITDEAFHLIANGERLAGRIVPSSTERFVTFFYDDPLPASTEVRVVVNGDLIIGRDGLALDADGDNQPGGTVTADFRTLPLTRIAGTNVFGFVFDSFSEQPIVGATIRVDAFPEANVVTDANGRFELVDMPAPEFFVHVDGSTATNTPAGFAYPNVGKPFHSVPGQTVQIEMNRTPFDIYLPPMALADIQPLSPTEPTDIGFGDEGKANLAAMFPNVDPSMFDLMQVTFAPGAAVDDFGNPATQATIIPVPPDRIPAPLPPTLNPALVISIQAVGATSFDIPAAVTFPNLDGLAPGEKPLIFSFDHDAGKWVVIGTGTVSDDGTAIVSDPGVGILAPGWHFVQVGSQAQNTPCPGPCFTVKGELGDLIEIDFSKYVGKGPNSILPLDSNGNVAGTSDWRIKPPASNLGRLFDKDGTWIKPGQTLNSATPPLVYIAPAISQPSKSPTQGAEGPKSIPVDFTADLINRATSSTSEDVKGKFQLNIDQAGQQFDEVIVLNTDTKLNTARIQQRLLLLGYHDRVGNNAIRLKVDGVLGDKTKHAMGVFNAAVSTNLDANVVKTTTSIDSLINSNSAPRWVEANFNTIEGATTSSTQNETWMTHWALAALEAAAGGATPDLFFTGASSKGGGDFIAIVDGKPKNLHTTHEAGMDLDFNVIGTTNAGFDPDENYDQDMVRKQIQAFWNTGLVARILFNDPALIAEGIAQKATGHGGHFHVDVKRTTVPAPAPGAGAAEGDVSEVPGFGTDPVRYYRFDLSNGFAVVGRANPQETISEVLSPNVDYTLTVYQPSTNTWHQSTGRSNASGRITDLGIIFLDQFGGPDTDGDGIPDVGETAIGTSSTLVDTDGDGITDDAEITQGLDPLDDRGFPTGIIATLPLLGEANAVVVEGGTAQAGRQTAYVATGSHGLAIVDVARFNNPIVLGQLELPGVAVDVSVDSRLQIAAVASSGGLHLVDVSDPMLPTLVQTIAGSFGEVEVLEGVAYAGSGASLIAIDLLVGDELGRSSLSGSITALAREGALLYVADASANLTVIDVSSGGLVPRGSVVLERAGGQLTVGGGIAYVAARDSGFGFMTVDVSDPENPTTISKNQGGFGIPNTALAANGSGLGLLIGSLGGQHVADLMDLSDPADTRNRLLSFQLDAAPQNVAIASGLGFVAGGSGGLTVLNYLPFDNQGQPPQVTLLLQAEDVDPATPGVQVVEGTTVAVIATVADDVQIRNVELLVDGQVVRNDVSFPFDLAAAATPGQTSIAFQVRATDTGGNATTSDPLVVELVADTFAPTIVRIEPADGTIQPDEVRTLRIVFSEPMDADTLTTGSVQLFRADDPLNALPPQFTQVRHDDTFLQMTYERLRPGDYRVVIDASALTDRAGNPLGPVPVISEFGVQQSAGRLFPRAGFAAGDRPGSVAVADLDGDGALDLVTANAVGDDVSVLLGLGDGTFAAPVRFAAGDRPGSVAVADLDGDGALDLVTANRYSDDVSVLLGRGDGTFAAPVNFAAGDGPQSVAVADLDGDGALDLVTANRYSDDVSVLVGRGDGTSAAPDKFAA
ncbi:MAG: VCBS repeat-containing protein, partial [Planctomycetes bacterium]|nr:VCBS repeat-containing protein [Planctomycetota bacterium]